MTAKMEALMCPACGQRGDRRPGLSKAQGLAEAAIFAGEEADPEVGSSIVALEWILCGNCGHHWAVAAGSVRVIKDPAARRQL